MKLQDLSDTEKGTCFIIGNGASLTKDVLEKIAGKPSFGMNFINLIYPETSWRPSFYCCFDRIASGKKEHMLEHLNLGIPCFITSSAKYRKFDNCIEVRTMNRLKDFYNMPAKIVEPIHNWATTLLATTLIASCVGFDKMVLLGCDLNYAEKRHFYGESPIKEYPDEKLDWVEQRMIMAHGLIALYSHKYGFSVVNATKNSRLKIWKPEELK